MATPAYALAAPKLAAESPVLVVRGACWEGEEDEVAETGQASGGRLALIGIDQENYCLLLLQYALCYRRWRTNVTYISRHISGAVNVL